MNITEEGEKMYRTKVRVNKPTPQEVQLHQLFTFGKLSGIEPENMIVYKRRKIIK